MTRISVDDKQIAVTSGWLFISSVTDFVAIRIGSIVSISFVRPTGDRPILLDVICVDGTSHRCNCEDSSKAEYLINQLTSG